MDLEQLYMMQAERDRLRRHTLAMRLRLAMFRLRRVLFSPSPPLPARIRPPTRR